MTINEPCELCHELGRFIWKGQLVPCPDCDGKGYTTFVATGVTINRCVPASPAACAKYRPYKEGTAFIAPFFSSGMTQKGLYVEMPSAIYPVFARVVQTNRCEYVEPGDVVRFKENTYDAIDLTEGRIYVISEANIEVILDGYDLDAFQGDGMKYGISGGPIPAGLPYSSPISNACDDTRFWPRWLYAIAYVETISGEVNGSWPSAATVKSGDGGLGLCQLTSPWGTGPWPPPGWDDPQTNASLAVEHYLDSAVYYWQLVQKLAGLDLVRAASAEYNAGRANALAGHFRGDVDRDTTGGNYGARVAAVYGVLVAKPDATTADLQAALVPFG